MFQSKKIFPFKKRFSLEERTDQFKKLQQKHPLRFPVMVMDDNNKEMKFLVPENITAVNLIYIIRKKRQISEHDSFYLFVNNDTLVSATTPISQLYRQYKDKDGFLYFELKKENTFG